MGGKFDLFATGPLPCSARGWSRVGAWYEVPGPKHTDEVRDYFGEEVALFFQSFGFFLRSSRSDY